MKRNERVFLRIVSGPGLLAVLFLTLNFAGCMSAPPSIRAVGEDAPSAFSKDILLVCPDIELPSGINSADVCPSFKEGVRQLLGYYGIRSKKAHQVKINFLDPPAGGVLYKNIVNEGIDYVKRFAPSGTDLVVYIHVYPYYDMTPGFSYRMYGFDLKRGLSPSLSYEDTSYDLSLLTIKMFWVGNVSDILKELEAYL